jgi:N6-adenosine-specific RNA methylase IME4
MKKYNIIYVDPPWIMKEPHEAYGTPYNSMSDIDIINLPISTVADKNSVLFLWTISSKLPVAVEAIKVWGFEYKTIAFTWIKTSQKTGMPNCRLSSYTLSATEICLLGMKGRLPKQSYKVRQVIMSPRERHSKKPDEVRTRIVQLCGDLPRIELFARQKTEGWDVWGNEVENSIELLV